jgi:hypothetical protein
VSPPPALHRPVFHCPGNRRPCAKNRNHCRRPRRECPRNHGTQIPCLPQFLIVFRFRFSNVDLVVSETKEMVFCTIKVSSQTSLTSSNLLVSCVWKR